MCSGITYLYVILKYANLLIKGEEGRHCIQRIGSGCLPSPEGRWVQSLACVSCFILAFVAEAATKGPVMVVNTTSIFLVEIKLRSSNPVVTSH